MTDIGIKRASEIPNDATYVRYPFGQMEVGDAFLLPSTHPGAQTSSYTTRVAVAASRYGKRHNVKFKCNKQACGGMRVERIK